MKIQEVVCPNCGEIVSVNVCVTPHIFWNQQSTPCRVCRRGIFYGVQNCDDGQIWVTVVEGDGWEYYVPSVGTSDDSGQFLVGEHPECPTRRRW